MGTIDSFRGQYAFLSNFSRSTIKMADGITYPTVEHAFQAHKSDDMEERRRIAALPTPGAAKTAGKKIKAFNLDWNYVRLQVMEECLREKFKNLNLYRKLKATSPNTLVEGNTWNDTYWGVCNGIGDNHLGKLLMKIRDE